MKGCSQRKLLKNDAMKKYYLLAVLISLSIVNTNAQFIDDMESYTDGESISEGHWTDWNCGGGVGCALMSSSAEAMSGNLSGLVPGDGTTNAILNLDNIIFGEWCLTFYMYVPTGKEASWNIQGTVPVVDGESIVGNFYFNENNNNPGIGHVENTFTGDIEFNFPHDEWFVVNIQFEISAGMSLATWALGINGAELVPAGTPFTNNEGDIPTSLGGVEYYSISGLGSYYLDEFEFFDGNFEYFPCLHLFDVDDNKSIGFEIYPNPVSDALFLQAEQEITSISIRTILGQEVYSSTMESLSYRMDVSNFASGTYFVRITVGNNIVTKKFIKL